MDISTKRERILICVYLLNKNSRIIKTADKSAPIAKLPGKMNWIINMKNIKPILDIKIDYPKPLNFKL